MKKLLVLSILIVTAVACKKKSQQSAQDTTTQTPQQTRSTTAICNVYMSQGYSYLDALIMTPMYSTLTAMSVNGTQLQRVGNATHAEYSLSITPTTFSGTLVYTISNHTITSTSIPPMATGTNLDTSKTVYQNQSFTITHASIACDSIQYVIGGKIKNMHGTNTSCTFSASDLSNMSMGANTNIGVSIIAINYKVVPINDQQQWEFIHKNEFVVALHYKP